MGALSVSALGRLTDPDDPQRGRRRVQRHLSGKHMPSDASVQTYADVLDVPREQLAPVEDDEEEPQVDVDLLAQVERLARDVSALKRALRVAEFKRNVA